MVDAPAKLKEAEQLMKKAKKYWEPSLLEFRMKPDWETAGPLFEKAGLAYRVRGRVGAVVAIDAPHRAACSRLPACAWSGPPHHAPMPARAPPTPSQQAGQLGKSIEALEKASHAQEKMGSAWHAAKHMETCSQLSKDLGAWPKVGVVWWAHATRRLSRARMWRVSAGL